MIKKLELTNFTAFDALETEFSSKVNVIIGENGTGKTHLLKAAYGLCAVGAAAEEGDGEEKIAAALSNKLVRLFMPLDDRLGKLRRRGVSEHARLDIHFALDERLVAQFYASSTTAEIVEQEQYAHYDARPVFIPTKEVLSLMRGMNEPDTDRQTIETLFDDTYLDLCRYLSHTPEEEDGERLDFDPRFGTIFPDIVNAIGGKYEFAGADYRFQHGAYEERRVKKQDKYGDKTETVFQPISDADLSNQMTAEGFRKFGILQQLLLNRTLNPGVSGPLFWDEPGANMNPKLMRLLVQILLELSRNGQQIVLATHDYVLLKWFDLLADAGKSDHVRFHALYRDKESKQICLESTDSYLDIHPNSIADTFSDLTDHEISKTMGGLGK